MTVLDAVEEAEIVGLGGNLDGYRDARDAGCTHPECVKIARLGGILYQYRDARDAGCTHPECVKIARLGGILYQYRTARTAGCSHSELVDVHPARWEPALVPGWHAAQGAATASSSGR